MTRQMTGAEMVVQALQDQGVEHIFGYPGGAVLPIYDALFHQDKVRHILVRHEQGAAHAAEGYARSTGKAGCVLVTSGPGATNAVTGPDRRADGFDPARLHHRPGADASHRHRRLPGVRHGRHHPPLHQAQLSREGHRRPAAHPARGLLRRPTGRPGPVVVDIPKDVQFATRRLYAADATNQHKTYRPRIKGDLEQDPRRGRADGRGQAAGLLHRRRRDQFRPAGLGAAARTRAADGLPDHLDADGPRRLSRVRPAMARHARHARHLRGQPRDARLRRDDLHRRALRRPHHRPPRRLLARTRKKIHIDIDPSSINKNVKVAYRHRRRLRAMCSRTWCACGAASRADRTRRRSQAGGRRSTAGARATASPTATPKTSSSRNMRCSGSMS